MKAPADCRLIGRWRIVEADIWDRAYLNLSGPATLTITAQGGEIAFGALEAGLEVEYARDSIGFCWAGCDEGDEVEGEGTAELLDAAPSKSSSPTTTATKPSSKPNETLLQQPASGLKPLSKAISLAQSRRARCATGRRQRVEVGRTLIELPKWQSRGKQAYEAPLGKDRRPGENRRSIAGWK
jgi:hypothetical protein